MNQRTFFRALTGVLATVGMALSPVTTQATEAPATGWVPILPPIVLPINLFQKPVQKSCGNPADAMSTSYFVSRDVRIDFYPGWSVDAATFRYSASTAGTYRFKIAIRDTSRAGDIVTLSNEQTVTLAAGEQKAVTTYLGNAYIGKVLKVSVSHVEVTGPGTLYFQASAVPCTGIELTGTDGSVPGVSTDIAFQLRGDSTNEVDTVVEYFIPSINKYFITGSVTEQATLDANSAFTRTGKSFRMPKKGVYGNTYDVYRFFQPAPLTQSHVYVDKPTRDWILTFPFAQTGLDDEGPVFATVQPDAAHVCPSWAPVEIRRSFHNTTAVGSRNHRYTKTTTDYNSMTAAGWTPENVVFCAYD